MTKEEIIKEIKFILSNKIFSYIHFKNHNVITIHIHTNITTISIYTKANILVIDYINNLIKTHKRSSYYGNVSKSYLKISNKAMIKILTVVLDQVLKSKLEKC